MFNAILYLKSGFVLNASLCVWCVILIEFSMLQAKVIDNISFRNFLELVPEVRELINDFYSRYAYKSS